MEDSTAVVTGGADGLGRAVAGALSDAGARVVVGGNDPEAVAATVDALPGEATGRRTDVRDEFDLERLLEAAARFGPGGVDVLVPAAGTYHGHPGETPLSGTAYAAFDDTARTVARGTFAAIREALPHMPPDGRVVVPTGAVGRAPRAGYGAYGVASAAAVAVARGFAAECDQAVGCVEVGSTALAADLDDVEAAGDLVATAAGSLDPAALDGAVLTAVEIRDAGG